MKKPCARITSSILGSFMHFFFKIIMIYIVHNKHNFLRELEKNKFQSSENLCNHRQTCGGSFFKLLLTNCYFYCHPNKTPENNRNGVYSSFPSNYNETPKLAEILTYSDKYHNKLRKLHLCDKHNYFIFQTLMQFNGITS